MAQGFETFDYRGADNQDIRSAKESTDVALDLGSKTQGPKFLFWHVMEPSYGFVASQETRGTFVTDPTVDVPFGFNQAAKITDAGGDRDANQVADVFSLYDEEILAVDQQLKRLVEGIGLENTIFIFTSDHGEEFWEHNDFEHGHHLKSVLTQIPFDIWGEEYLTVANERWFHMWICFERCWNLLSCRFLLTVTVRCCWVTHYQSGRMVLSENTLYGDPLLSVVSETHRLEINQESKMAALWTMDDKGMEVEVLSENPINLPNRCSIIFVPFVEMLIPLSR